MTSQDISTQLRQFVRTQFEVGENDGDFNDNVHLFDYGYVDSFGAVTLTSFVEKSFNVEIKEADLIAYPMNSITEISQFVVRRQNGEI